jgi:hypothetical protein
LIANRWKSKKSVFVGAKYGSQEITGEMRRIDQRVSVQNVDSKRHQVTDTNPLAQEEFIRDRLPRILRGDVHGIVRGLRRMATVQKLSKEKRADADAACGYFTAHTNRLTYAWDEFQQ